MYQPMIDLRTATRRQHNEFFAGLDKRRTNGRRDLDNTKADMRRAQRHLAGALLCTLAAIVYVFITI